MKWVLAIWLLCAGGGVSYSVVAERRQQILLLKAMEASLKQVSYYMYQWRMPVEEVLKQMIKEEDLLQNFYVAVQTRLLEKAAESFGKIWQEESNKLPDFEKLSEEMKTRWSDCFLHMPMETGGMNEKLLLRQRELTKKREEMEEKYRGEQRLVLAMGFFSGAFLCLILW